MSFDSADQMIARVNAQVAEAEERAAKAREMRIEIEQVRGRAFSSGNTVEAVVDSTGRLTGLSLSEAALDQSPGALAALIVKTTQAAHRRAGEKVIEKAAEAFGEDSDVVERVRGELAEKIVPDPDDRDSDGVSTVGYR